MIFSIPEQLIDTAVSAAAIILGALMGGLFSYFISKKNTLRNIKHDEFYKNKQVCQYANIIRLDICTALFQSIRTIKESNSKVSVNSNIKNDDKKFINRYPIPINKDYSCAVASLSDKYSLKELSYIYQLYGIIEKLNHDILNCDFYSENCYEIVLNGYIDVLRKVYGDNYKYVIDFDIEILSYEEVYDNNLIKEGYRDILKKLDCICIIENL